MNPQRLVLVAVETDEGYRVGTGYAVAPNLILSARHLWRGETLVRSAMVRFLVNSDWLPVSVMWSSSVALDACLLHLRLAREVPREPLRWGHYDRTESVQWRTVGYASAARVSTPGDPHATLRDTVEVHGWLEPGGAVRREQLELEVRGTTPEAKLWRGLSGAPVFCGDYLIGVVGKAPPGFRGSRLWATPVQRLLDDGEFARAVGHPMVSLIPLSPLSLVTPSLPSEPSPAMLLTARYRVVPFLDDIRQRELDSLDAWSDQASSEPQVRCFTGAGGTGKTRLFIEWCERLRQRGWDAGFLEHHTDEQALTALMARSRNTFVAIDYAETHPYLFEVLYRLTNKELRTRRLHIALIVRHLGEWLTELGRRDEVVLQRHLARHEPLAITPVRVASDVRTRVFVQALEAFAAIRGGSGVEGAVGALDDRRFMRVLYIHMAALAALDGEETDAANLLQSTLDREQRFWERYRTAGANVNLQVKRFRNQAARAVAAITLLGGAASEQAATETLERVSGPEEPEFVDLLRSLYPGSDGEVDHRAAGPEQARDMYLAGLEPDILGEALIVQVMGHPATARDFLTRVFAGADFASLWAGLTILGRISLEKPTDASAWIREVVDSDIERRALIALRVAVSVGRLAPVSTFGSALADSLRERGSTALADRMRPILPRRSLGLRPVILWVYESLRARLTAESDPHERASILLHLGLAHSDEGDELKALDSHRESVQLFRALHEREPDDLDVLGGLAAALSNLGISQHSLGRFGDALRNQEESVSHSRALSARDPQYRANLARTLVNVTHIHVSLQSWVEGERTAREAIAIWKDLDPGDHRNADIARAFVYLGSIYEALERPAEALEAYRQKVEYFERVAGELPDQFLDDYVSSLTHLAMQYYRLGHHESAHAALGRAVNAARNLPSGITLARNLFDLSVTSRLVTGDADKEIDLLRETVAILESGPSDDYLLGTALVELGGSCHNSRGAYREALGYTSRGVDILLESANATSSMLSELVRGLENQYKHHKALGEDAERLVPLMRLLENKVQQPEVDVETIQRDLWQIADLCQKLGENQQSMEAAMESSTYPCSKERADVETKAIASLLHVLWPDESPLNRFTELLAKRAREHTERAEERMSRLLGRT